MPIEADTRVHFKLKTLCLITWCELDQFGFYRPGVIIIQTGTLNDALGVRTIEVSRRATAPPP